MTQPHLLASLPPHVRAPFCWTSWTRWTTEEAGALDRRPAPDEPRLSDLHLGHDRPAQGGAGRARHARGHPRRHAGRCSASRPDDRMPCLALSTFDISLFELLSPLLTGGTARALPAAADAGRRAPGRPPGGADLPARRAGVDAADRRRRCGAAGPERRTSGSCARSSSAATPCRPSCWTTCGRPSRPPGSGCSTVRPKGPSSAPRTRCRRLPSRRGRCSAGRSRAPCSTSAVTRHGELLPHRRAGRAVDRRRGASPAAICGRDELTAEKFVLARRRAVLPQRRPRAAPGRRHARVPRPSRPPGQGARLPHRARGDRGSLGRHPEVREAVAGRLPAKKASGRRLVAYVVPPPAADRRRSGRTARSPHRQSTDWQDLYDETYGRTPQRPRTPPSTSKAGTAATPASRSRPRRCASGWTVRWSGCWLSAGRRILEVGCGTGLLLFRVAPRAELIELYQGHRFLRAWPWRVSAGRSSGWAVCRRSPSSSRQADDWSGVAAGGASTRWSSIPWRSTSRASTISPGSLEGAVATRGARRPDLPGRPAQPAAARSRSTPRSSCTAPRRISRSRSCGGASSRRLAAEEELLVDPGLLLRPGAAPAGDPAGRDPDQARDATTTS